MSSSRAERQKKLREQISKPSGVNFAATPVQPPEPEPTPEPEEEMSLSLRHRLEVMRAFDRSRAVLDSTMREIAKRPADAERPSWLGAELEKIKASERARLARWRATD